MTNAATAPRQIERKAAEAAAKDVGRGIVRLDPDDLATLALRVGDTVIVKGKRSTAARAMPTFPDQRGRGAAHLDGITRANAGLGLDDGAVLSPFACPGAETVTLKPAGATPSDKDMIAIGGLLDGLPVTPGDRVRASLFGGRTAEFIVESCTPSGHAVIAPETELYISKSAPPAKSAKGGATEGARITYEDVGGLKPQLRRIREMIELPLRFPEVFDRLGIDAPKGVLLYGPPGTGKTLIARAIAHEVNASFYTVSGPEIIHKHYGESEGALRKIWDEATKKAPAIIFIDEIDSIAPRRDTVQGEVEKRVVAQLLALMDGLRKRSGVMVIAATNLPNSIDPALRRPGRFDREIEIPIPDRTGRRHILDIHSRGMPLVNEGPGAVDLGEIAGITHGCVGADLEALCREAAMACLRDAIPGMDFGAGFIPPETLASLAVTHEHFRQAFADIQPSAIREVFVEVPSVRWHDVGGLEDIKRRLIEAVEWPLHHADLFEKAHVQPPKGVLLAGPPGVGKTLIAKAVATESEANFISVKGPELIDKFVGESEKALREVFRKARQAAPCIVFFDEIDALIPKRASGDATNHVAERVMSQFLAEMDGVEDLRGVLILGATNRLDRLDPAVIRPGRFDEVVELGLPDEGARTQIFSVHLRDRPVEDGIDPAELARIADGASGAQIAAICTQAALAAVRRGVHALGRGEQPEIIVTRADLDAALGSVLKRAA